MTETKMVFTGKNVPILAIAKAMNKSPQFVRIGIRQGLFKFGQAIKINNRTNYYCSDKAVYEEIGFYYIENKNKGGFND